MEHVLAYAYMPWTPQSRSLSETEDNFVRLTFLKEGGSCLGELPGTFLGTKLITGCSFMHIYLHLFGKGSHPLPVTVHLAYNQCLSG